MYVSWKPEMNLVHASGGAQLLGHGGGAGLHVLRWPAQIPPEAVGDF